MARAPRTPKKASWQTAFLEKLAELGTVTAAAKATGVGRRTVYDELARNPQLQAQVDETKAACVETVESSLYTRAVAGDNTAAIFYLKGNKPDVYGDGLRADQIRQIRQEGHRAAVAELEEEIARLPKAARDVVMAAMARTTKELNP